MRNGPSGPFLLGGLASSTADFTCQSGLAGLLPSEQLAKATQRPFELQRHSGRHKQGLATFDQRACAFALRGRFAWAAAGAMVTRCCAPPMDCLRHCEERSDVAIIAMTRRSAAAPAQASRLLRSPQRYKPMATSSAAHQALA
jgi:hypothetical protein